MGNNKQLDWIEESLPDYEKCREEFFEHFYMFLRLGAVNYAALGHHTGFAGPVHEVVGIFLAGLAIGRVSEISEAGSYDLYDLNPKASLYEVQLAWSLIEDELEAIRPEPEKGGSKEGAK